MRIKKIIFVGTSEFACPSLLELASRKDYQIPLVVSQPDKPAGRNLKLCPSPVSALARDLNLPLECPEQISAPEFVDRISALQPDLIITASYGGMLGKALRHAAPLGAINLHPSLLPKYRGASPIQEALRNGDSFTGISIFRLSARMDAGPILAQKAFPIAESENYAELHDRLASEAAIMLMELLDNLQEREIIPEPQDEAIASYCHKIEKQDMLINWKQSAVSIVNLIRSLAPSPAAFQYLEDQPIKFIRASVSTEKSAGEPGTIQELVKNTGFTINTGDYQLLVSLIQPAGKKIMSAWAFTLGQRSLPGTKIWK
ncbi:MAG TPA: methionyl-tRNA formyltransferase [Candidatus Cloacimonadota bacterium]|nr:methionyl-tRNA formyltransferase [Candidatus Cloacimonadota bacterium]